MVLFKLLFILSFVGVTASFGGCHGVALGISPFFHIQLYHVFTVHTPVKGPQLYK